MAEKRYVIVRICTDNGIYRCPTNNGKCLYPKGVEVYCKKCVEINGDTKEQLIHKVAQASINYYERRPFSKVNFQDMARWIVEFLGVEE